MKIWIIASLIGLLVFAGIFAVSALQGESEDTENTSVGCGSCGGDCNSQESCSLSSCGINTGGSCGCSTKS